MLALLVLILTLSMPTPSPEPDPREPAPLLSAPSPALAFAAFSDSLAVLYASRDVPGMKRLYARATSLEQRLLGRYRLYPVTQDEAFLDDLPDADEATSAREYALLSALWAYRVAEAPPWKIPSYGKRSEALLERAKSLDADAPFVLLVDGQALLYKPALFGGDLNAALQRFTHLRRVLLGSPHPGLTTLEADVWAWYAMHKLEHASAEEVRQQLLAQAPPRLFRDFLTNPP
ncbi:MAG: hypothetical protein AAGG50_19755 [Bacteroidota bacterium]